MGVRSDASRRGHPDDHRPNRIRRSTGGRPSAEPKAAHEHDRGVVLLFDEVHFLSKTQLEALIEALHKMVQRKLPITMVGAGLPQIAELAGDAKSYAERLVKFPAIDNLRPSDAKAALSRLARTKR